MCRATWIRGYFVLQKMSYNTRNYRPNQELYMDPNLLLALVQYLNIPPPHSSHHTTFKAQSLSTLSTTATNYSKLRLKFKS
jgi:hypothetical protein